MKLINASVNMFGNIHVECEVKGKKVEFFIGDSYEGIKAVTFIDGEAICRAIIEKIDLD